MSARRRAPIAYQWEFKARFRRGAFGWKSNPAIQRIRQAVSEMKKVARRDPALAADGAVLFLTDTIDNNDLPDYTGSTYPTATEPSRYGVLGALGTAAQGETFTLE